MSRFPPALGWLLLTAFIPVASAEPWNAWRGPRGDGTSLETKVPTRWSEAEGVLWKVPLPGRGHASPIVWQDHLFTITTDENTTDRLLLAVDRTSGKLLWQQTVLTAPLEEKHPLNSFASSTPTTDGQLIYVSFLDRDQMLVAAYDFAGQQRWLVRPGPFSSKHGFCTCPVLFENLLIVNGDHDGESYLAALDRATGQTVWKIPRPNKTRSYCTPIIREIDGRTQMILSGTKCVTSYDPRTGNLHWQLAGPTEQFVASMVYNGQFVFLTAGFPEYHILAIRPTGTGQLAETDIAWRTTKGAGYVPSPIICGDYFLVVTDNGVASCFRASDGERMWMERLGAHHSGSLVTATGLVYFTADDGVTRVVRPGPKFELEAENRIDDAVFSSLAISQGAIFIRGEKALYCIGPGAASQARTSPAADTQLAAFTASTPGKLRPAASPLRQTFAPSSRVKIN
jgi:outer membrane protein assembly factor BamB